MKEARQIANFGYWEKEKLEDLVKKRTQELAIAKKDAEESDKLKSAFLATMSHELRTPLNSVIGFTGILLQKLPGPLNDEQSKQLKMVQSSARHLLNLINDVLDISKIEAGQLKIIVKPFNMCKVVDKVVQAVTPLAKEKRLVLLAMISPEVDEIISDRRRVEQILINLLNNAVKFTNRGRIKVECIRKGDKLITSIVDTGIGIRNDDKKHLFKSFRQLDPQLGGKTEGTGLGLAICKKLVDMLDGEIWMESQWNVGSTFTFILPVKMKTK